MTSKAKFIGAVEIGTSKVTVLVGEITNAGHLHIIGRGEFPSRGVVKGNIVDFRAASETTHRALIDAEKNARVSIDEVYLAQSGDHIDGFYNEASVNVTAADNMVGQVDMDTVTRLACSKNLPEGRVVIDHLVRPYRLDGRLVADPENLVGKRLDAACWTVHGLENKIANHIHIIRGFNLRVSELVVAGLASGALLTTAEDRQAGVLVIDIGAGTTDYALFRDGCAQIAGTVPVGGSHLTNDLGLGLRVTEGQAEKLKHLHGRAVVTAKDRADKVWLNGDYAIGDRQFPRMTIEQITAARVWEIFEVVKKKLGAAGAPEHLVAGVVLTGGTSRLAGIEEAAARAFGVQARLGEIPHWVHESLRDPAYSTALGLLQRGFNSRARTSGHRRSSVRGFFKQLFTV